MINVTTASEHRFENIQTGYTIGTFLRSLLVRRIPLVSEWKGRMLYRQELSRILETGSHLVLDMGIGLEEARYEIGKPFYIE